MIGEPKCRTAVLGVDRFYLAWLERRPLAVCTSLTPPTAPLKRGETLAQHIAHDPILGRALELRVR
jgi:hypothetical protein